MVCTNCGSDNPADATFCEQCGHRLALLCPACKASVGPDARFCRKCGAGLNTASTRLELCITKSSGRAGNSILAV
ncbi:MAG: zinc-ribbon domain-containing protein [Deltaproteobacteria bacterium]|nr:zinc-ribbon domain-containing protein [Deltaproteobacteria bacterium]